MLKRLPVYYSITDTTVQKMDNCGYANLQTGQIADLTAHNFRMPMPTAVTAIEAYTKQSINVDLLNNCSDIESAYQASMVSSCKQLVDRKTTGGRVLVNSIQHPV